MKSALERGGDTNLGGDTNPQIARVAITLHKNSSKISIAHNYLILDTILHEVEISDKHKNDMCTNSIDWNIFAQADEDGNQNDF